MRPRDPLLTLALVLASVASLVPVWSTHLLPFAGWPELLARAASWHRLSNPAWGLSQYYARAAPPMPGWAWLFPLRLAAGVMSIEVAGKLLLSLAVVALPVGLARLARSLGRSPWLALFAAPLAWNALVGRGDLGFALGLGLLPWTLDALERFLDRPSPARCAAWLGLISTLWLTDALVWLAAVLAASLLTTGHLRRARVATLGLAAAALVPSLIFALRTPFPAADGPTTLVDRLGAAPSFLILGWSANHAWWLGLFLLALWGGVLLTARTDAHDTAAAARGWPYRLEVAVLGLFVGSLYLPAPAPWVVCAAALGVLLPHGGWEGRRLGVAFAVWVLVVVYPIGLARSFAAAQPLIAAPARLARHIPRGHATLTLVVEVPPTPMLDHRLRPFDGAHAWPQLRAGGYDGYAASGFPFRPIGALPRPPVDKPLTAVDAELAPWDNLLVAGTPPAALDGPNVGLQVLATDGEWRLYGRRE